MIMYDWKPFPGSCREPLRLRSARSRAIIRVQLCRRCLVNRGPAGQPPPPPPVQHVLCEGTAGERWDKGSGQPRNSWWDWPLLPLARSKEHRSGRVAGSGVSSFS